jgi:2-dehydropantoate 2-reductase
LETVADVFRPGGYKTVVSPNIRRDIWAKLVINVTMNLLSTVTMGTVAEMYLEPLLRENVIAIIGEMRALGAHLGIDPGESKIDRMKDAHVKTSMLQDLERGRPLELDSIAEAVVEIGERAGVPMPHTRALLGLVRVRAKTAGLV